MLLAASRMSAAFAPAARSFGTRVAPLMASDAETVVKASDSDFDDYKAEVSKRQSNSVVKETRRCSV